MAKKKEVIEEVVKEEVAKEEIATPVLEPIIYQNKEWRIKMGIQEE